MRGVVENFAHDTLSAPGVVENFAHDTLSAPQPPGFRDVRVWKFPARKKVEAEMRRKRDHIAPEHLSDRSKALWNQLVPDRAQSPGRRVLLELALADLDLATEARDKLRTEGHTFVTSTTGAVHLNPLFKVLSDASTRFTAAWTTLTFDFDEAVDDQP